MSDMERKGQFRIQLALPLAYQDSRDNYDGFMRYVTAHRPDWKIEIIRDQDGLDRLKDSEADGQIVSGGIVVNRMDVLTGGRCPLAIFDCGDPAALRKRPNTVFIDVDSKAITRTAFAHFSKDGTYDTYAFVGTPLDRHWAEARARHFEALVRGKGCAYSRFRPSSGISRPDALLAWLRGLGKPAAVHASNDITAAEVLEVCSASGLRVPDDIAVIGVDNEIITCSHTHPTLTSVQPDFKREGYLAAYAIDRMLRGRKTPRHVICSKNHVVERGSTGATSPAGRLVRKANELIAQNFAGGLQAADVARRLKVSRRLLDLRYRQITGKSLLETILGFRLERMKALLDETNLSLDEVGTSSGFATAAHARRAFLQHVGMTMRDYRNSRR